MNKYNNKEAIVNGQTWYFLVVQPYKNGKMVECAMDPFGLMILGEMVDGYVYAFKLKHNRDAIYSYVMKDVLDDVEDL